MFPHVITDSNIFSHDFIVLKPLGTILLIDLLRISPHSGTMFLSSPILSPGGQVNPDPQSIGKQKKKDSFYTVLADFNGKRMIHGLRQTF